MSKTFIGGLFAVALAASPAHAQTAPAKTAPAAAVQSRAQVQALVARQFGVADANHDGFISKAEAEAMETNQLQKAAKRADPDRVFGRLDTNKDGKVTRAEANAVVAARAVAKGKPAGAQPNFDKLFARADTNRDGAISRAEFEALPRGANAAAKGKAFGDRMFAMRDTNKDGRMSLAEAQQAALARFDRVDANHDGTITAQERTQLRQQRKAQRKPS